MKKQKILYLITKSNWGGAQRYVFDLATSLDPTLFEPVVAAGGNGFLFDQLSKKAVRTIPLFRAQRDIHLLKEWHLLREIIHILRTEQPNILHVNSSKLGGLGALAGRICGIKHIIFTAHGWPFHEQHRPPYWRVFVYLFSWLTSLLAHDTIVVTQEDYAIGSGMLFTGAMHYIPLGIGPIVFLERANARASIQLHLRSTLAQTSWIGSIGELHKNKGFDTAIRALAPLCKDNPHVAYFIMGDGEERASLERLITELEVSEQVFLMGHIPDAATLVRAFDLFLIPSRKEGLPYTLLEALAAPIPIIASSVGGIPDVLTHRSGHNLIPPESVEALQSAIRQSMLPPSSHQSPEKLEEAFYLERMLAQTIQLYGTRHA